MVEACFGCLTPISSLLIEHSAKAPSRKEGVIHSEFPKVNLVNFKSDLKNIFPTYHLTAAHP